MKRTVVTDNLTQLTRLRVINAYFVRDEDGLTLVDTALPKMADDFIDAARSLGLPIVRIALTHGHTDHVGSVDALKERLGDAVQLCVPQGDAAMGTFQSTPDVLLAAGDRVGSLEVVPSPGHTMGHIAFRDTRDGTLIAGDVYSSLGGLRVTSHRNLLFPLPAMGTVDRALDLESARTLRALEPTVLVVGHGRPVRNPAAAMDAAIERATRALS
jgi:glyoxylase-like metal-dependent hydrolase (beta-lactamase superfamily II)